MVSDAVGPERVSRILGYKLKKGTSNLSSPNLPHRIAILGEANHSNQGSLSLVAKELTSAKQAGDLYGYGSPIHLSMLILRPSSGDGVGGIPVIAYPQAEVGGATAKVMTVTPVGVATGNGTHYLIIAGRNGVNGVPYALNIEKDDTVADINQKIEDAINAVLGSPVTATSTDYVTTVTSKWRGLTAQGISITVDTGDNALGLTYVIAQTAAGAGTPSIAAALALFGNEWNTIIDNTYGLVSTVMDALEAFNGIPDPANPTGRYGPIVFKPFIAISGSVLDDPSSITDTRDQDVTIAVAPAPGSAGLALEAAANMVYLFARQAQNNPNLDVAGSFYPDMPTPVSIGSMADYTFRDSIVQKGCSTVDLVSKKYQVQDFVTTYHPDGEVPPQFRYPRNLNIDWNFKYGWFLILDVNVANHSIANDNDTVSAADVVKPKQVIQLASEYADDLVLRAINVDAAFMKANTVVAISTTNPDRIDISMRYKRSGYSRIISTDGEANFNFGTLN